MRRALKQGGIGAPTGAPIVCGLTCNPMHPGREGRWRAVERRLALRLDRARASALPRRPP